MMVARQFIAWDVSKKATRPIGRVRAALSDVFTPKVEEIQERAPALHLQRILEGV